MNKLLLILSYILFFFNVNLIAEEKNNSLKVGLLAPFTGEYKDLGNSLLLSIQLALDEIDDENIIIIPRDSGSNNKIKLNKAIQEIIEEGAKVIIGPVNSNDFQDVNKFKETIFISLSNISPEINSNIISIGISLESQLKSIQNFIINQKKNKTLILYPDNSYAELIEKKLEKMKIKNYKIFKYSPDPKILTGEIEKITNYSSRKRNLELRKELLEDREDQASINELKKLEQLYTLGNVNFDSVIVIDFGSSLKSALTSLIFSDVNEREVLFTTVNQWFDKSIFFENSLKTLYYPSIDYKNYQKYNKSYTRAYGSPPSEITILAYDALGLIYYIWKKNNNISSIKDFLFKNKIKGKIGTFSFTNNEVKQKLDIYKVENNKFTKF